MEKHRRSFVRGVARSEAAHLPMDATMDGSSRFRDPRGSLYLLKEKIVRGGKKKKRQKDTFSRYTFPLTAFPNWRGRPVRDRKTLQDAVSSRKSWSKCGMRVQT